MTGRGGLGGEPPLVSIVTPSLNAERFLEEAIRSIAGQDYPRIEHIVIDGASTDGTVDILRRYGHLVWTSKPDGGQADAVNRGIRLAHGDVIGWLNADDVLAPGAVRLVVDHLATRPAVDIVYGDCLEIDAAGVPRRHRRGRPVGLRDLLLLDFVVYQPSVFFRRHVFDRIGLLETRLDLAMDYELLVRAARRGCRFDHVARSLSSIRVHPDSKSSTRGRAFVHEYVAVFDAVFADPVLPRSIARLRPRAYSNAYFAGGVRSYEEGQAAEARVRLWRSLCARPHPLRARTFKTLLLLLDTALGLRLRPLVETRMRRRAERGTMTPA